MKNELKISTVSIICVLCSSVISGAYAASSVRSLGGAGTYSSAASASQSGASTGVARAGSVRITPTAGKATATAKPANTPSTTAGRVSSPRLSLGKYLGGNTAISGGSSTRPNGGGNTSGGGTSTIDPGLSAELNNRVNVLEDSVSDLKASSEDLAETKQDKLVAGDYISIENGEVFLDVKALGDDTIASVNDGKLMLSIAGGTPIELVQLSELLSADDMNAVIDDALATKGFATQDALQDVADDVAETKTAIAANKEAIDNLKAVSGDVADLTDALSGKANKQTAAVKDTIAVIGDAGQYVGSDKKLSDFATTASVNAEIEELKNTIPTNETFETVQNNITELKESTTAFETKMTELKTTVEKNMGDLEKELAATNTTINNITNEAGQVVNIAPQSITSVELKDGSVTDLKLADGSVTNAKLAQKAVKLNNLDTEVSEQLVGAPDGETDGMYVMLVTPSGERVWADLAMGTEEANTESGGATN